MRVIRLHQLGVAALTTAVATLIVIGVWSFENWKKYQSAFDQRAAARMILDANASLVDLLKDAEIGQRGYLLTGKPEYLAPYDAALAGIPGELDALGTSLQADPRQYHTFQELHRSVLDKLAELRTTIDLYRSRGAAAALPEVDSGRGKQLMDVIRATSREIAQVENARLVKAFDDLRRDTQDLRVGTLIGISLLVILVIAGGVALNKSAIQMQNLISELEESRRATEHNASLLSATLYSIGDAVITTNRRSDVQMMNTIAQQLTGWTEDEARGRPIGEVFCIVNEYTRKPVDSPVDRVLREGQVVGLANHTVLISKTGAETPIDDSGAPIRGLDGSVNGAILVFRDVSARRRAFQAAAHLAAIVENTDDAIIGKNLDGIVTSWNRGAEHLFGYTAQEMIGTSIDRLIPPDHPDDMRNILGRVAAGAHVEHFQTERITKDGRRLNVSLAVSPIRNTEGTVVGASKIARDITHETQLEEMLRHTQKMQAIGRLAGGVAHDFNNLLTVILTYATTAMKKLAPSDPLYGSFTEILKASERAAALTGQLLAFSRKQVTQFRTLDLNQLIRETEDMLRRLIGEDIDLAVILDPALDPVKADPGHLSQILMNLAANARDAMPVGGKLTIETRAVMRESEDIHGGKVRPAGPFVMLAITDNGVGMDEAIQSHLFEPFFTTKETGKGTGLGLATVHGIVEQHQGWIDVYSEPGHGASFKIYLPALAETVAAPVVEAGPQASHRTGTILLVEDEAAIRLATEDVLSDAGNLVLSAVNGRAALRLLEERPRKIDLLITDVVMPEMSGPELAEQLARLQPGLSVLYVSGYTDHSLFHRGAIEQGTAFLPKPFLPQTLLAKVDEMLGARPVTT